MNSVKPGFFARLALAWRTLTNPDFAAQISQASPSQAAEPKPAPTLQTASVDSALQLLGLLQQEGRFIDFLEEDVSAFSDNDIGAAARVVHEGCRKSLRAHLSIAPVREEQEGHRLTLQEGFDASSVRLTGNVVGQAPFTGTLAHRGWQVVDIKLPKLAEGHNVKIVAPAEVEL